MRTVNSLIGSPIERLEDLRFLRGRGQYVDDLARKDMLHAAILRTTARQVLETIRLWTRPHAENLRLLREQHGTALMDEAIASGRGVIIAAPHHGNWELLNQWLAWRTPLAILYRPPE